MCGGVSFLFIKLIWERNMHIKKYKILLILLTIISFGGTTMAKNTQSTRLNTRLNAKQVAIATAAAYTAQGNMVELKKALAKGLDAGVTINEFKEILIQSYAYCGFPRSLNALGTLMQLVEERNYKDKEGKLPSKKPEGDSLVYGTKNQTKLVGKKVEGKIYEFAPTIDEYLKAHLFGDIFSRDNVDWQTRELATVAMLAVRENVENQLNSHINVAKNNGLTDKQIKEILNIANEVKMKNVLFGLGKENKEFEKYFIGKSYVQPLTGGNVKASNVTFEPGCRNNWHIHHKSGQTLMVIYGRGYYQEWGKKARELKAGDIVEIKPGVKHWHGAAKDSWFTHVAISESLDGATTEWLEEVGNEEYGKLK